MFWKNPRWPSSISSLTSPAFLHHIVPADVRIDSKQHNVTRMALLYKTYAVSDLKRLINDRWKRIEYRNWYLSGKLEKRSGCTLFKISYFRTQVTSTKKAWQCPFNTISTLKENSGLKWTLSYQILKVLKINVCIYMFCILWFLSSIKMSSNTKYFAILHMTVGVSAVDERNLWRKVRNKKGRCIEISKTTWCIAWWHMTVSITQKILKKSAIIDFHKILNYVQRG